MKTVTYTQMRSELSDILELLREGKSITVTQRGKPDIVVRGSCEANEANPTVGTMSKIPEFRVSPEISEGIKEMSKQLNNVLNSSGTREAIAMAAKMALKLNSLPEEFAKALSHTQSKHAEIIKKLEDK
ncbi:type II toxin-antitoxin system prevent-host-death family antitoxin [Serratia bockelmannii]|uniref:type II toxin-antitoxin system Phd/YefM family antitoxin n=1 Tax=Serratia TaxID=613 RepID=UPI0018D8111C|nr:type II toxin-antitoxin system prevent-host-death family antitoxin [Serratia bockelmannii]MBH2952454.1 type II toxin-antitoxin system prevent-host-death family antitoxin [Serratia marcescens]MCW7646180.1 type II toxin-antitoxin system prevent-host-death family antitoxin [Serratia bockelmannii]MCW7655965.1 type II toxin-antitoxin system prevent-host-death family antitoxin [Serratia bockelmannii]MCW7675750.1 type II toxin-antitoxin system prevent-host-death family antitoxin [Serratia bockelman